MRFVANAGPVCTLNNSSFYDRAQTVTFVIPVILQYYCPLYFIFYLKYKKRKESIKCGDL